MSISHKITTLITDLAKSSAKRYNAAVSILEQERSQKILWTLVIFLCFGVILFLNMITPRIADDFAYLYIFGEKEQVGSLGDLFRSQINHYNMWGGRSVVHFIAQALLQLPIWMSDILNSIVYLVFVTLIYAHIKGRNREHKLSLFLLINLAVWFIIPMFGDTILWLTGSTNYLWGTSIILAFLLPYRVYEGKNCTPFKKVVFSLCLFIFGVIAGWTNENTAAGMIVIILLFFFYYSYKGWKIPLQHIVGLIGAIIGYIIMIKAPGNFVRSGESTDISLFIICYRFVTYTQKLFLDYGLLIIAYAIITILYNKFTNKREDSRLISYIYILGALAAIYAMLFSPQFPARAWFGIVTFFIIALGNIFYRLNFEEEIINKIKNIIIIVSFIAFSFSLYDATKDIHKIYKADKERELIAKEARESGAEKCYFKMYRPSTTYIHGEDSETHYLLSYYYGIYVEYD